MNWKFWVSQAEKDLEENLKAITRTDQAHIQYGTFDYVSSDASKWHCSLFGCSGISLNPTKGDVPCWFWRQTQWLLLGNKWRKEK